MYLGRNESSLEPSTPDGGGLIRRTLLILMPMLLLACESETPAPLGEVAPAVAAAVVFYRVTVGGPDVCEDIGFDHPGCDGNFSLVAMDGPNGVTGQWEDAHGLHVSVNCLEVRADTAWVSGLDGNGQNWLMRALDGGTSANDPPDQISSSRIVPLTLTCGNTPRGPGLALHDMPRGQVIVN